VAEGGVPRHPLALERLSEAGAFSAMPTMGAPPTAEGPATFPTGCFARRQQAATRSSAHRGRACCDDHVVEATPEEVPMAEFPAPKEGIALTHFIVSDDVERSRRFYTDVLGGEAVMEGEPTIVALANGWIIINVGGGPTDDKPTVTLETPPDAHRVSSFLNVRVADIQAIYDDWSARGAKFLTPPQDRGREIRCYLRDPDGHLIEVGQATGVPQEPSG
jgi:catechol 2,3-dioxygenase-like lactoylglutathione lyase family enzyme